VYGRVALAIVGAVIKGKCETEVQKMVACAFKGNERSSIKREERKDKRMQARSLRSSKKNNNLGAKEDNH
jgi:hypothetical protein